VAAPVARKTANAEAVGAWQTVGVPVLLIRHAHAGSRKQWDGPDDQRPLSDKGFQQAARLVRELDGWAVQRVLSSPYVRCVQTVEALARELGVPVEVTDVLAEGHGAEAVDLVRSLANDKVALCTHGDVIPEVLVTLADEDRLELGPDPRQAKGSVWILEATGPLFTRATYLPPGA
jgi:phosphohistidine phosphatase SixA